MSSRSVLLGSVLALSQVGSSGLALQAQETTPASADTLLWTHAAREPITFRQITGLGSLAVASTSALVALDPTTGTSLWARDDIGGLKAAGFESIPFTQYGVVRSKDGIALLDLETGRTVWDSTGIGLRKVRGYFGVPAHNLMLVLGESDQSKHALVAVSLDSGVVRWTRPALFDKKPETEDVEGIHTIAFHQPPVLDSDSTIILYLSKDGPIRLDVRTGERLWRADALRGKDVPLLGRWYAPLLLAGAVLYVPYEQKVMALDARTGQRLWDRDKKLKSPVAQMELVERGLLVRGARPLDEKQKPIGMPDAFIDLLDVRTGASIWPQPFDKMKDESVAPFLAAADAVYFGDRETFYRIAMDDGTYRELLTYKFQGGEEPAMLERREDGFLLLADHNLMLVGAQGAPGPEVYYPAPGASLLTKVGRGMMFVAAAASQAAAADAQQRGGVTVWVDYNPFIKRRLEQSVDVGRFSYVYTRRPGKNGREGFSLVKIRRTDLGEVARLWLDERSPDYVVDEVTGTVFLRRGERELIALRFPQD